MDVPTFLLAVGGPRHGDWLPYRDGDHDLRVAVMVPLSVVFGDNDGPSAGSNATFTSAMYDRRWLGGLWVWLHVG